MADWEIIIANHAKKIGRFMDKVEIVDFVEKMELDETNNTDHSDGTNIFSLAERTSANNIAKTIATEFGEVTLEAQFYKNGRKGGVVVCGHRGEVAPDMKKADTFELDNGYRTQPYADLVGSIGIQK
eukprot:8061565-Ditylum_brightwellii.AAC.1